LLINSDVWLRSTSAYSTATVDDGAADDAQLREFHIQLRKPSGYSITVHHNRFTHEEHFRPARLVTRSPALAYTHVFPEGWNTLPDEMKLHILKYTVPSDYTYYASHFQRDGSYRSYKALSALE
jgi:hypothetical protein